MKDNHKKEVMLLNGVKEIEIISLKFIKELTKAYKKNKCAYKYIVLTTRRCFCLYYATKNNIKLIIKNIFWFLMNYKYLKEIDRKICSSQSVDIIGNKFKDSIVLLVDDIMIHGQTVYSYYEKISKYEAKTIDTLVLVRNVERPDYYYVRTKKDYLSIYNKVNWDWRDMSNKIVSYLHDIGQLYVSYVYGYAVPGDILNNVIKNEEFVHCKEDYSYFIKHPVYSQECQPRYYYLSRYSRYNFIKYALLRVYPYKRNFGIKYKIIPYIELANFKSDNIHKIWRNIWISDVPKELEDIKSSEDIYKAITAVLSFHLCKKLFGSKVAIATSEIDKSFVKDFLKIVEKNLCDDPFAIFSVQYEDVEGLDNNIIETELKKLSFSVDMSVFDTFEKIKQYFYCISSNEEKAFGDIIDNIKDANKIITDNQIPIVASDLYNLFPEKYKIECLGFMMYLLDNGVASHVVKTICSEQYVVTSLKAGEQSYHLFSDLLGSSLRIVYHLLTCLSKIEDINTVNAIKSAFIDKLKKMEVENFASIEYVLNRPPVNLRADYFGILNLRSSCLTLNEIKEEQKIMAGLREILQCYRT